MQICCIITWKSSFFHDAPKTLIIDALIREKAGFLMTRPKNPGLYDALLRLKAIFFRDTPKTFIFLALLCGKAGFLLMHQKLKCVC